MQYLLMNYGNEASFTTLTKDQQEQRVAAFMAYMEALTKAGVVKSAHRLRGTSTATTVRVVDGKSQILDGPYADSKEQVGGFLIIDVPDLDTAISWAARCPAASNGIVEVRPIWNMES